MKKALRILLLLALSMGVLSAGSCRSTEMPPESLRAAEKVTVEAGIEALMYEKGITDLSKYSDNTSTGAPVRTFDAGEATNDMTVFPSTVWHLYDGRQGYIRLPTTEYYYTIENDGTVRQFANPTKTVEYLPYSPTELSTEERRAAEKDHVQQGVQTLMTLEELTDLSLYADGTPTGSPVRTYDSGEATNDMTIFPSQAWHLYREPDEGTTMFFRERTVEYYYTVENDGTVRQFGDAAKTVEYNAGG
jgi:hypothetical protein